MTTEVFLPQSYSSHSQGVSDPFLGNSTGVNPISEEEDSGTF